MSGFQANHTCALLCTAMPGHRQAQGKCVRQPLPWASLPEIPHSPWEFLSASEEAGGIFQPRFQSVLCHNSHTLSRDLGTGLGSRLSRAKDFLTNHLGSLQPLSRGRSLRKGAWSKTKQQKCPQFFQFPNCGRCPKGTEAELSLGLVTSWSRSCERAQSPPCPSSVTKGCSHNRTMRCQQKQQLGPHVPVGTTLQGRPKSTPRTPHNHGSSNPRDVDLGIWRPRHHKATFPLQFLHYNSAFNGGTAL